MFDIVRDNKRIAQAILAVITLPFAFWGVESYIKNVGSGPDPAKVAGTSITMQEFQEALREQQERMRPSLGGRDPSLLDTPEIRSAVLDSLVQRRLLQTYAAKNKLTVSNEQLVNYIASVPSLQENGVFSPQRYEALIAAQNMSKQMFEYKVRQDLTVQQAVFGIGNASISGAASADRWLLDQLEEREFSDQVLRPEAYLAQAKVAPEEVKAYYEANLAKFNKPEQVRIEYLVLSRDELAAQVSVSAEDIKSWYDAHPDRYKQAEERRASHILLALNDKSTPEQVKAAEAKAAEVLAQLKKAPADFARLAKEYSQDPGSAAKGGDLEWFARGAMVKPFEEAVFSLKEGQLSDVVRSDFGLHIIKVTGIRAERVRPLDDVRGEITAELKAQAASRKYVEQAEGFSNTVYEQSDSLAPAAEKYKLTLRTSDWLTKGGAVAGVLGNAKLQTAVFSSDALKEKRNTEAVEVAPNVLVSARVVEYKPAAVQPLEAVSADINKRLMHDQAVKLAVADGEQKLARLQKGEKVDFSWGKPKTVVKGMAQNMPREAVSAIYGVGADKLPAYAGLAAPGGYVLFRVSAAKRVAEDQLQTPQAKAMRAQYARLVAEQEVSGWMDSLRSKYSVDINKSVLESKDK